MRVVFIVVMMILTSTLCCAEIYKWVDENGRMHFSDKPMDSKASQYAKQNSSQGLIGTWVVDIGQTEANNETLLDGVPEQKKALKLKSIESLQHLILNFHENNVGQMTLNGETTALQYTAVNKGPKRLQVTMGGTNNNFRDVMSVTFLDNDRMKLGSKAFPEELVMVRK